MSVFVKDPAAKLDYEFDWSDWLDSGASETISSHDVTVESGLTHVSDSESAGVVTVWLSGGAAGTSYTVECEITTSANRIDERTIIIKVQQL